MKGRIFFAGIVALGGGLISIIVGKIYGIGWVGDPAGAVGTPYLYLGATLIALGVVITVYAARGVK